MQMHIARRLSEAIGSWLHLEFCCYRAGLFSESSLKAAVGSVLSSFPIEAKGVRVYADFAHEALNPPRHKGRKRSVDFALTLAGQGLPKNGAQVVVEVKWAGSSHCSSDNIFRDFVRLSAIKRADPAATCIFVLAGKHAQVERCLRAMPFISTGKRNTGISSSGNQRRLTLDSADPDHRACFGAAILEFTRDGFSVPESFMSKAHGLHPRQTENGTVDFQAIAWDVAEVSASTLNPARWQSLDHRPT